MQFSLILKFTKNDSLSEILLLILYIRYKFPSTFYLDRTMREGPEGVFLHKIVCHRSVK